MDGATGADSLFERFAAGIANECPVKELEIVLLKYALSISLLQKRVRGRREAERDDLAGNRKWPSEFLRAAEGRNLPRPSESD